MRKYTSLKERQKTQWKATATSNVTVSKSSDDGMLYMINKEEYSDCSDNVLDTDEDELLENEQYDVDKPR